MNGTRGNADGESALAVTQLRSAARKRVAETSLRKIAREIEMSAPGLRSFLDGTSPRTETLEKIRAWYFNGAGVDGTPVETVRAALHVLLSPLRESRRTRVLRQILDVLAEAHRKQGNAPPAWLVQLREEHADAP